MQYESQDLEKFCRVLREILALINLAHSWNSLPLYKGG